VWVFVFMRVGVYVCGAGRCLGCVCVDVFGV